jgi:hypothetical protein
LKTKLGVKEMIMDKTKRNQLSRRIMVLYYRVLVDIRNWIYEGEIDMARDAADYLEPITIDFFNLWLEKDEDIVNAELHAMIESFVKRHKTRYYYHEIFDLDYDSFQKKYLPIPSELYTKMKDMNAEF